MEKKKVKINKEKCNGCGRCVTGCMAKIIKIVDGKAVIVSDEFCDRLGACISICPRGAITIEKNEN